MEMYNMNINTITEKELEGMTDQELNTQINKICTDYSNRMKKNMKNAMKRGMALALNTEETELELKGENCDRIELALSNIRAAMAMLSEGPIKSELRCAEHHLTRGE